MSSAAKAGPIRALPEQTTSGGKLMTVSGWGRYPKAESMVYRPEKIAQLGDLVRSTKAVLARGAGKAYGDAALNADGRLVDVQRLNRMLSFDAATGILRCEAGVTMAELLSTFLSRGFFPPVTPGTRHVTLGGSIAADVHGKNHHRDSSLGKHVVSIDLLLASGEVAHCSRTENSELFAATIGGMGLTGIIVELELGLTPVESAYIVNDSVPARDIDHAIEIFEEAEQKYRLSVGWFDSLSRGKQLGRGFIQLGNFARLDELDSARRQNPFAVPARFGASVPMDLPNIALIPLTVRVFNSFISFVLGNRRANAISSYDSFFYPLDRISNWNRIYGKRGFVQYQCVWPMAESRSGLVEVLEAIAKSRRASFLTVLKKFGPQEGLLSFPMAGYTLALDFPVTAGLFEFLDGLDRMVMERGGRVYLAKDARMRPETFRTMYPNFKRWIEIKNATDPAWCFNSNLARRLGMDSSVSRARA
jgi:FAD/FMN-containing dehydrogenase